ncbi:MAG: patatin-like phospholipase family protein [Alphaproteobacteria bacterium]|nr:patatin-like phospholipase family protein [Alphaproteobacteria bacterium]
MSKPVIALALGSGAARGWAHIGVIDALVEAGIKPDIVCGTSMGALVGAVYSSGQLDKLRDWAMGADWRVVASMVDVGLLAGGLVDGVRIVNWLGGLGLSETIEDLPIPFGAVATDISSGREIWLRSGPLPQAIRASIGMPGVFSPVKLDGRWLSDGGLVNPVPVSLARAMGADFIIAVNLNEDLLGRRLVAEDAADEAAATEPELPLAEAGGPASFIDMVRAIPATVQARMATFNFFGSTPATPGYFDVLANAIDIMQDHITRSRLAGEPPHVLVLPRVVDIAIMDFHRAEDAIAEGRAAAERVIPIIEAKLARRA